MYFRTRGIEVVLTERPGFFGIKVLATEDINEGAIVSLVVKMHRDGGGFNKLQSRVALQTAFAKFSHQRFAVRLHIDSCTELL